MKCKPTVTNAIMIQSEVLEALEILECRVKRRYGFTTHQTRKLLRSMAREAYCKK